MQKIGTDEFGNEYFEKVIGKIKTRKVKYKQKNADPSQVPLLWNMWLTQAIDKIPQDLPNYHWIKEHRANFREDPLKLKTFFTAITSTYKAWQP